MTITETLVDAVGPWWPIWALGVAILGSGRLTRLLVHDVFPPAMWWRQKWSDWVVKHKHEDWGDLFFCWWCLGPWITLACIASFFLTFLALWVAWVWWLFWGWLTVAYVVSMVVARDEPKDGGE